MDKVWAFFSASIIWVIGEDNTMTVLKLYYNDYVLDKKYFCMTIGLSINMYMDTSRPVLLAYLFIA